MLKHKDIACMRKRAWLVAGAIGLVACHDGTPSTQSSDKQPIEKPLYVRAAPVSDEPVSRAVRAAGLLASKDDFSLAFKVGGVVRVIDAKVGQRVKKGTLLASLDQTEVRAMVEQAQQGRDKAQRDRERMETLYDKGQVPLADLQNVRTQSAVSSAALQAAEFNYKHTSIVAPDDGWVTARKAEPGEVVAPGQAVVRFSGQRRGSVVRVPVSDRDVLQLRPMMDADITVDALSEGANPTLRGRISEVSRTANPMTGTFEVEVALAEDEVARLSDRLLAGLSAKVVIHIPEAARSSVPLSSLVESKGSRASVFVIGEDKRARKVPVEIAFLVGERAALRLPPPGAGEVASEGSEALYDGALVEVQR